MYSSLSMCGCYCRGIAYCLADTIYKIEASVLAQLKQAAIADRSIDKLIDEAQGAIDINA